MKPGPVVGIAGASYEVARPWGDLATHGVPRTYVDHILAAGGRPVILPPRSADLLDVLDALVLAGGGDLDPNLYGGPDTLADGVDTDRDRVEIDLVRRAQRRRTPVLGVCRGAQILAVAYGGTLVPDLGEEKPHVIVNGMHPMETCTGSVVSSILGGSALVNSLHHQAIDDPVRPGESRPGRVTGSPRPWNGTAATDGEHSESSGTQSSTTPERPCSAG